VNLVYTDDAAQDLAAIVEYGVGEGFPDPIGYVNALSERLRALAAQPLLGRKGRLASTRELVLAGTPYIAVYRVEGGSIIVVRVLHGAQQWRG
jgi:toxin ParE1/3/4